MKKKIILKKMRGIVKKERKKKIFNINNIILINSFRVLMF